jgi:plastocyanin
MRKRIRRALKATALVALVLGATASIAGAAAPFKYQVTVSDDFSSGSIRFVVATVPEEVQPATVKVGFANNSVAPHVLIAVGGLPAGITEAQFIELLDAVNAGTPPPAGSFDAGAVFSKPGQDHQKQFDLTTPGQYGYFCPIPSPEGVPHYKEGFVGLFKVVAP